MFEIPSGLIIGIQLLAENVHWVLIGVALGMFIGTIPGMGGIVTLTLFLPFTLAMEPHQAFAFMSGGLGATTFAGSLTAILINTPGTSSNAATLIDGYPLTQKGEASTAIAASAISSAIGAIIGTTLFILFIPVLIQIALLFGPSEVAWLVLTAIIVISVVIDDRPLLGITTGIFGVLLALVGTAPQTGENRFTFGQAELYGGVSLIAMIIGLFALAEIVRLMASNKESISPESTVNVGKKKAKGITETLKHKWLIVRCSLIGLLIGAIPGAGGSTASFVAYGHGAQSVKDANFGSGNLAGVIAPEASNDAKDGGQLFPSLGLGIPGSGSMAVFLAAFLLHGFLPGPQLLIQNSEIAVMIALSLLLSNVVTSAIGLIATRHIVKILKIPIVKLLPAIVVLAMAAVFIDESQVSDLYIALIFGVIGLIMIQANVSRVPIIVGFVLGAILEENYFLATAYADGNIIEAFFTGYVNWILVLILLVSVISIVLPKGFAKSVIRDRII